MFFALEKFFKKTFAKVTYFHFYFVSLWRSFFCLLTSFKFN